MSNNSLVLGMQPVASEIVFEVLFDTDNTVLTDSFMFITVIDLVISSTKGLLYNKGKFLGLPCEIFGQFYHTPYYLTLSLVPFTLGYGNIEVYNNENYISSILLITPGYLFGNITGIAKL